MNEIGFDGFKDPLYIKDRKTGGFTRPPLVVCGLGNPTLGRQTAEVLGDLLCKWNEFDPTRKEELMAEIYDAPAGRWPDNHRRLSRIRPELSGRHVFIFNNPWPEPDKRLMETFFLIDAARGAGAARIEVILPYFAYGRGDKKSDARTPIEARVVARTIEMLKADKIITLDIHAEQTMATVLTNWDNVFASHFMIPAIQEEIDSENAIFMSTDTGGLKRTDAYNIRADGKGIAFDLKARTLNADSSDAEARAFFGDVEGRDVAVLDDESVSLRSVYLAVKSAADHGARRIVAGISHLKDAIETENTDYPAMWKHLNSMPEQFVKLITTDSIEHLPEITNHHLVRVLPTADFFAEIIWSNFNGVSLSPRLVD